MENKSFQHQLFILYALAFAQVQLQIPPAYIVKNSTGCLNISISENVNENSSLWIMFNEVFLCNLTNFHNPDPSVDINANYKGRIQCSVTESYNKASICFTMGVKTSDAGVYDARLFKDSDEFITNNTLYVKDNPEPPRNLSVICSDARYAALFWIPGSDRGAHQKFVVTYNIPNMRAQNNHTVWGNSLMISNLERRQYVFSLTAINAIGESKPVQARCTIRDLDEGSCLLSRFFGSLFGLFLLISVGLFSFIVVAIKRKQIIIYKCCHLKDTQNSKSENVSCTYEFQNVMSSRNSTSTEHQMEASRLTCSYEGVNISEQENFYESCGKDNRLEESRIATPYDDLHIAEQINLYENATGTDNQMEASRSTSSHEDVAISEQAFIYEMCIHDTENQMEAIRPSCTYGNVDVADPENVYDLCQ